MNWRKRMVNLRDIAEREIQASRVINGYRILTELVGRHKAWKITKAIHEKWRLKY